MSSLNNMQNLTRKTLPAAKRELKSLGFRGIKIDRSGMGYLAFCPTMQRWHFIPFNFIKDRIIQRRSGFNAIINSIC